MYSTLRVWAKKPKYTKDINIHLLVVFPKTTRKICKTEENSLSSGYLHLKLDPHLTA